jgi:hypothetical protein
MTNVHQDIDAYQALTNYLGKKRYTFVCPSPETQGRVVRKRSSVASTADAKNMHDFFGWSLPCSEYAVSSVHLLFAQLTVIQRGTKIDTPRRCL